MMTTQRKVSWYVMAITVFAVAGLTTALAQNTKNQEPKNKAPTKVDADSPADTKPAAAAPKNKAPAKNDDATVKAPTKNDDAKNEPAKPAPAATKPAEQAAPAAPVAPPVAKVTKASPASVALAKQIRDAKKSFVAPDPASMNAPWAELHRASAALDKYLKRAPADNAASWRDYMNWDALAAELKKRDVPVSVAALKGLHDKLTAGYSGLELQPFHDVASALEAYLISVAAVGNADLKKDYDQTLEELADAVETVGDDGPDDAQAAIIGRTVGWLKQTGQASAIVDQVTSRYSQPNLLVDVNEAFVADLVGGKLDETEPVRDVILGTNIRGTGRTIGNVSVDLVNSADRAVMHAFFNGTNHSKTVGHNRGAVIYSTGTTELQGQTTLFVDETGVSHSPSKTHAVVHNKINGIGSTKNGIMGKIVVKVASKKAPQQQGQAQQIAARHAEVRLSKRLNDQMLEVVNRANADYQRKLRAPLDRFDAAPRRFNVSSTDDRLLVRVLQDRAVRLAAPGAAPQPVGSGAVARLHHSLIDNTTEQALAGRRFDRARLDDLAQNQLGIEVPPSDDDTPFAITFADKDPLTVAFDDGEVAVTLRGKQFMNDNKLYEGMNITAKYKAATTPSGIQLTREGDLIIYPPGFRSGTDKLSLSQTALRRLLQRRFDKMLPSDIEGQGVELEDNRGTLVVSQLKIDNGWAVLGWQRKANDKVAAHPAAPVPGAE